MIARTTGYYRELLDRIPAIEQALCWTVVRGVERPVTVEQVAGRIGGDPATLAERAWEAAFDHYPACVVHLARVGSAVTLFEVNGGQGHRPEVLRRLSDGAAVHSVYWHVNGADRLVYAAYGRVIAGVDVCSPGDRHGVDPTALDGDLREFVDGQDNRAAAMAVVENRTGVRLRTDWFEHPRLSVIVAEPVPNDPHPPTGFASADPDLHVSLSLAGPDTRRAALARVVGLLADRYDLAGEPAVSQARAALAPGGTGEMPPRVLLPLRGELDGQFRATRDQGPMQENPAWRRMQAVLAICAAVGPPDGYQRPLDALIHARCALPEEWGSLREELRGLARAGLVAPEAGP